MSDVSIFDPLTPYFFAGVNLGAGVHDILALLHVDELDAAWDDDALVLWGIARIDSDDPNSFAFSPQAGGGPINPNPNAAGNNDEVWEWHDLSVRFRLTVPRRAAQVLVPTSAAITDTNLRGLLEAYGATTAGTATDFPGTQFRLELLLNLVTITIPGLRGAKLESNGLLVADPLNPKVKLKLPRILLIVEQGNTGPDTPFSVRVGSWGASGLDGQSQEIATMLEMVPPYAFVGDDNVFGFGFRALVIDLDDSQSPPELLEKFGIGEDWQGVYLPEVRIFIAPNGLSGFAVNAGVKELMIGIGDTPGVWGDFMVDVVNQGAALQVAVRFADPQGNALPVETGAASGQTIPYTVRNVPNGSRMLIDVQAGAAPYGIKAIVGLADNATMPTDATFDGGTAIDLGVTQQHTLATVTRSKIAVRITSRNPSQKRYLLIDVFPRTAATTSTTSSTTTAGVQRVRFGTTPTVPPTRSITIDSQDENSATLLISPADNVDVTAGGSPVQVSGGRARISVARNGGTVPFTVTWNTPSTRSPERLNCYFKFDEPDSASVNAATSTSPSPSNSSRIASSSELTNFVARRPSGTMVRIDGFASYENTTNQTYDLNLSMRRAESLAMILNAAAGTTIVSAPHNAHGHDGHPLPVSPPNTELTTQLTDPDQRLNRSGINDQSNPSYHWRAMASYTRDVSTAPVVSNGTLTRDPFVSTPVPTPPRDVQPPASNRPDFLREIGATVRILQSEFIALELRGKVDFHTSAEQGLETFRNSSGSSLPTPAIPPRNSNPDDGVVDFRLNISHDDTTNIWTERLLVQAAATDRDGLWSWGEIPTTNTTTPPTHFGRDLLGLYFAIAPLAAESARGTPDAGDVVGLIVSAALPPALAALNFAHVLQFTLYGAEVAVKHHGAFEDGKVAIMFDVESAIWLNLAFGSFVIARNRTDKPIKIRYKAIGFTINAGFDDTGPFVPVFDSSKGYTIDLADSGSLQILPSIPALGDIIQLAGARIARTNPLNLEVELALGVDLGVFSVDKIGFRLPLSPPGAPTLTSLGVGIEIPNVIIGKGQLTIREDGFSGSVDITLPSVGLRIAAALAITSLSDQPNSDRTATGVYLSLIVELPAGIPLGGTGLGIFGFQGLFAMHYARKEPLTGDDKALRWLRDPPVSGEPTKIEGWGPALDKWAFGVGIMLGTMEGTYVIRMTGMLALELPGPRVLFFLKASLLNTKPPGSIKSETGTLIAVIDISPASLLIGIQVDYKIDPILEIMIPVEGFFGFDDASNFHIHIGTIARPITAKVFEVFKATAYLMIAGQGIPDFPLGALQGFSIAAGFHVSITWGYVDINLYLRVAAGFDAGIGFSPFFIAGRIYLEGELHLFIISIEARGELEAQSDGKDTWVHGSVCGSIDLFFFSIEGCVSFELGVKPGTPHAPALLRDLALQSRSPALARGTAIDRGVDTVLCRGTDDESVPIMDDGKGGTYQAYVPIDAIPIVQFESAPELGSPLAIVGALNGALPGGNDGWRKRGELLVRYKLDEVKLSTPGLADPVTPGERPNTWRQVRMPSNGDAPPIDLALLDWSPDATPKAFEAGEHLDEAVEDRYEDLCKPVAEAAPVMWTFQRSPIGPQASGWDLEGEVWPDPPGTIRSLPVATKLKVTETWHLGGLLDAMRTVIPARVVGTVVPCPPKPKPPKRIKLARELVKPVREMVKPKIDQRVILPFDLLEIDMSEEPAEVAPEVVRGKQPAKEALRPELFGKGDILDRPRDQPAPVLDRGEEDILFERTTPLKPIASEPNERAAFAERLLAKPLISEAVGPAVAPSLIDRASKIGPVRTLAKPGSVLEVGKVPAAAVAAAAAKPSMVQPIAEKPSIAAAAAAAKPGIVQPIAEKPAAVRPEAVKPEAVRPEAAKPEAEPTKRPTEVTDSQTLIRPPKDARCRSKVLIAPFEPDTADAAPADLRKILDEYLRERFKTELADVVRFEGGPFTQFRCLMLLRRQLVQANLYQGRAFDREGNPIDSAINIILPTTRAEIPAKWLDQYGPWFEEVFLGVALFQLIAAASAGSTQTLAAASVQQSGWVLAIVEYKLAKPAWAIEFGIRPLDMALHKLRMNYPAYVVAAMEGLTYAEEQRAADDASTANDDADGLEATLAADQAARALMFPGRRYDVTVRYSAEVGEERDDGIHVVRPSESFTTKRSFYTDPNPPARLTPWVLCQFPSPEERFHFYDDPIVVVFGTDDVTQLFGAYGRDLRGVVRDASFRPPPADPNRLLVAKLISGAVLQKLGGVVFSPWEQTVRRQLDERPCKNLNPDSPRHERAVLDLHMEPSTEYVFDVEAPRKSDGVVPPVAGPIVHPLYRENLQTSRYANRQAMAKDVLGSYIAQRRLPDATSLSALAELVPDQVFDDALIAAGLGVGERVTRPRITILWRDGTPPKPFAIYFETPEPLWRSRLEPEATRDSDGRVTAWELKYKTWLYVDELVAEGFSTPGPLTISKVPFIRRQTGTRVVQSKTITTLRDEYLSPIPPPLPVTPPPAGAQVTRFVRDASGCRVLAILGNNARGRTVSFGLVRNLNPLIDLDTSDDPVPLIDVYLEKAPWEVTP